MWISSSYYRRNLELRPTVNGHTHIQDSSLVHDGDTKETTLASTYDQSCSAMSLSGNPAKKAAALYLRIELGSFLYYLLATNQDATF